MNNAKIKAYSRRRTYWEIRCVFDNGYYYHYFNMTVDFKESEVKE